MPAGLPYAWVNLRHGMENSRHITENNVAACGSLLLEMGTLSRLTGFTHNFNRILRCISLISRLHVVSHLPITLYKHKSVCLNENSRMRVTFTSLSITKLSLQDYLGGVCRQDCSSLSIPVGNPVFEDAAARALEELWGMRSSVGLFGSTLDMEHRQWKDPSGGIGPSSDSFYEYLIKAYILLGACFIQAML